MSLGIWVVRLRVWLFVKILKIKLTSVSSVFFKHVLGRSLKWLVFLIFFLFWVVLQKTWIANCEDKSTFFSDTCLSLNLLQVTHIFNSWQDWDPTCLQCMYPQVNELNWLLAAVRWDVLTYFGGCCFCFFFLFWGVGSHRSRWFVFFLQAFIWSKCHF